MGLIQTAFDFGPPRPAPWLDPEAERARKQRVLEQRLGQLLGSDVALTVTDNARTMLSARRRDGIAHVRLHRMFVDADETTVNAVARYLTDGHRGASSQLQRFIGQHRAQIRAREQSEPRAPEPVAHTYDLHGIFGRLNAHYFADAVVARIAWARRTRHASDRARRRSIKLGSYRAREPLICVHPVLDAVWVPDFFVDYIVYHEMLHHVIAMPVRNGRRSLHGPEFRARERKFERYADAIAWERANLDRLLSG